METEANEPVDALGKSGVQPVEGRPASCSEGCLLNLAGLLLLGFLLLLLSLPFRLRHDMVREGLIRAGRAATAAPEPGGGGHVRHP